MSKQLEMFPTEAKERRVIYVFEMWPHFENCAVCGTPVNLSAISGAYYLPMYEGKVVNPDIQREWGGFPVCPKCYAENVYKTNLDAFGVPRDKFLSEVWV